MDLASGVREEMGPELLPTVLFSLGYSAPGRNPARAVQLHDCTIGINRIHT